MGRSLVKTLLLILGIAGLVVLSKGFPQVRGFLKLLFLHPVGWVFLGLLGFWFYRVRTRPAREVARIIDNNSPKRIPPPPQENEQA